eukprot:1895968-Rhodomonas_salina.3
MQCPEVTWVLRCPGITWVVALPGWRRVEIARPWAETEGDSLARDLARERWAADDVGCSDGYQPPYRTTRPLCNVRC